MFYLDRVDILLPGEVCPERLFICGRERSRRGDKRFYTGEGRVLDKAGRVEKFKQRAAKKR